MSGESYLGNVASLFRPCKVSTILKSFFRSPLQSEILFCNITDLLLLIVFLQPYNFLNTYQSEQWDESYAKVTHIYNEEF